MRQFFQARVREACETGRHKLVRFKAYEILTDPRSNWTCAAFQSIVRTARCQCGKRFEGWQDTPQAIHSLSADHRVWYDLNHHRVHFVREIRQ